MREMRKHLTRSVYYKSRHQKVAQITADIFFALTVFAVQYPWKKSCIMYRPALFSPI